MPGFASRPRVSVRGAAVKAIAIARSVIETGASVAIGAGDRAAKRSRVNDSYRLERVAFDAARLGWLKTQGCFTQVIRYQTRLFVPVGQAPAILAPIAA